jgi:hypothetical protein
MHTFSKVEKVASSVGIRKMQMAEEHHRKKYLKLREPRDLNL